MNVGLQPLFLRFGVLLGNSRRLSSDECRTATVCETIPIRKGHCRRLSSDECRTAISLFRHAANHKAVSQTEF